MVGSSSCETEKEPGELLKAAEKVILSYNPKKTTLESHATECLEREKRSEMERVFVREVFYGVMQRKAALKAFMTAYMNENLVLRSDYTLYTVLCYLCVFRLEELTVGEFRRFVVSQDPEKMIVFLEYIFVDGLDPVMAKWTRIFDPNYVHDVLASNLEKHASQIRLVIGELRKKSQRQVPDDQPLTTLKKKPTVPKPPNLTKPKPRRPFSPTPVEAKTKQQKGQPTTMGKSASGTVLVDERPPTPEDPSSNTTPQENNGAQQHLQHRASDKPLTVAVGFPKMHETRSKLTEKKREQEEKEKGECDFEGFKARKPPPPPTATVRYNAAAILREDALFRARQAKEASAIKAYESELRDASEFYAWQSSMRARDEQVKLDQIGRTRILAKASADEAKAAKEEQLQNTKNLAKKQAEETEAMREQRKFELELALMENKEAARKVKQVRDVAPRQAMAKVVETRSEICKTVQRQLDALLEIKKQQDAKRQLEITERVKKLKAEQVKEEHVVVFDPTESSGVGLLDEMSLVEMKVRIQNNHLREKAALERKRADIKHDDEKRKSRLKDKEETCRKTRELAAEKNRAERIRKTNEATELQKQQRLKEEAALAALMKNLNAKREEATKQRQLLKEEEERRAKQNQYVGASESLRQQRIAADVLKGAERAERDDRRRAERAAELDEAAQLKAKRQAEFNRANALKQKRRADAARSFEVHQAKQHTYQEQKHDFAQKRHMYRAAKARHRDAMDRIADPYAVAVNQASIALARQHKETLKRVSQRIAHPSGGPADE